MPCTRQLSMNARAQHDTIIRRDFQHLMTVKVTQRISNSAYAGEISWTIAKQNMRIFRWVTRPWIAHFSCVSNSPIQYHAAGDVTCMGVKAKEEERPLTVPTALYCLARLAVLALSFCFWVRAWIRSRPLPAFLPSVPRPTIWDRSDTSRSDSKP